MPVQKNAPLEVHPRARRGGVVVNALERVVRHATTDELWKIDIDELRWKYTTDGLRENTQRMNNGGKYNG